MDELKGQEEQDEQERRVEIQGKKYTAMNDLKRKEKVNEPHESVETKEGSREMNALKWKDEVHEEDGSIKTMGKK